MKGKWWLATFLTAAINGAAVVLVSKTFPGYIAERGINVFGPNTVTFLGTFGLKMAADITSGLISIRGSMSAFIKASLNRDGKDGIFGRLRRSSTERSKQAQLITQTNEIGRKDGRDLWGSHPRMLTSTLISLMGTAAMAFVGITAVAPSLLASIGVAGALTAGVTGATALVLKNSQRRMKELADSAQHLNDITNTDPKDRDENLIDALKREGAAYERVTRTGILSALLVTAAIGAGFGVLALPFVGTTGAMASAMGAYLFQLISPLVNLPSQANAMLAKAMHVIVADRRAKETLERDQPLKEAGLYVENPDECIAAVRISGPEEDGEPRINIEPSAAGARLRSDPKKHFELDPTFGITAPAGAITLLQIPQSSTLTNAQLGALLIGRSIDPPHLPHPTNCFANIGPRVQPEIPDMTTVNVHKVVPFDHRRFGYFISGYAPWSEQQLGKGWLHKSPIEVLQELHPTHKPSRIARVLKHVGITPEHLNKPTVDFYRSDLGFRDKNIGRRLQLADALLRQSVLLVFDDFNAAFRPQILKVAESTPAIALYRHPPNSKLAVPVQMVKIYVDEEEGLILGPQTEKDITLIERRAPDTRTIEKPFSPFS